MLAGTSGQAATMFILRTEGAGREPSQRELNNLQFVFFLPIQNHVYEPGTVASACNSITQEAEAGKTLSKEKKKMISTKLTFPCLLPSLHLGAAGLPATSPLPLTYLLCLTVNFPMVGH